DELLEDRLFGTSGDEGRIGEQHAVAFKDLAGVGEVEARHREALAGDVMPDVELGPVADREDAEMLAGALAAVEEVPQLGALVLWVPLAEFVAVAEEAFFRAGFLFVAATAADGGVELPAFEL